MEGVTEPVCESKQVTFYNRARWWVASSCHVRGQAPVQKATQPPPRHGQHKVSRASQRQCLPRCGPQAVWQEGGPTGTRAEGLEEAPRFSGERLRAHSPDGQEASPNTAELQ